MGSLTWNAIWEAAAHHGGSLVRAVLLGGLLWAVAALAVAIGLHLLFAEAGWLHLRGERSGAARVVFALALYLLVGPLFTAAGLVYSVRNAVTESIRVELERHSLMRPLGEMVMAPLVLSHLLAQGGGQAELAAASKLDAAGLKTLWERDTTDVSFLLDAHERRAAVSGLPKLAVDQLIERVPVDSAVTSSEAGRWIVGQAKALLVVTIVEHTASYEALFTDLRGEAGRLSYPTASSQVGMAFWQQQLRQVVEAPFDQLSLVLWTVAALVLLVVWGLVQLIGRAVVGRRQRRQRQAAATP